METLEVLLRGLAVGAVLAVGVALLRSGPVGPARWVGAVFCLSVAAFAVHSGGAETRALSLIEAGCKGLLAALTPAAKAALPATPSPGRSP